MKHKKKLVFLVGIFFILIVQAYQSNGLTEKIKVLAEDYFSFHESKDVNLADENACLDPTDFKAGIVTDTQITFSWNGKGMTDWEYYIQDEGIGLPPNTGAPTTKVTSITTSQDSGGNALSGNTTYEYYVRVICEDGTKGPWQGPNKITTKCSPFTTLPFKETFDTDSTTFACWTILDDGPTKWQRYNYSMYEGDRVMYFYSYSSTDVHDNWLISPTFTVTSAKIYELSFYYKTTSSSTGGQFDLLLSNKGIDKKDFTTVISPAKVYTTINYTKAVYHVTGYQGNINFAWHIKNTGSNILYIDSVNLEVVDCISPDINNIKISNVTNTNAVATWKDDDNTKWEYFVTGANGTPPAAGSSTTQKTALLNTLNGGGALQPNTEYDFYLRSNCGTSSKSKWIGPVRFRTLCDTQVTPFFEGFNTDSATIYCWNKVHVKNPTNEWKTNTTKYEGTHSMYYYSYNSTDKSHDAWLISPSIAVTNTKYYRISYYYRTSTSYKTDFEVRLSSNGIDLANFTTVLGTKKKESSNTFVKDSYIIGGIHGSINIGWRVNGEDSGQYLYIDAVNIEEVACPEPNNPKAINLTQTGFDITWEDKFNKDWEYIVQEEGGPNPTGNGTPTTNATNAITKDSKGDAIVQNTAYEFYVRSKCASGDYSEWIGPIVFRTPCGIVDLPFWEGFNKNSETIYCWEVKNEKQNQSISTWKQNTYGAYEGGQAMYLYYYEDVEANDWLISPTFKLDAKKTYRFKYHYRGETYYENNTFEVMASNTGKNTANFTKELVKKATYKMDQYAEKKLFITNYGGDVNLAWHSTGKGSRTIYIDNVFLEEVVNCPEPLDLAVANEKKDQVDVSWTDDFKATAWEYYVQEMGGGLPSGKGTATSTKTVTVKTDQKGGNLKPNTDYEFYVRTTCGDGTYSIWAGPFVFTTTCDVSTTPFWEGFNSDQLSIRCWSLINNTKGGANPTIGDWTTNTYGPFEGDRAMYFYVYDWSKVIDSDSYLVTPAIVSTASTYVLKYHYKGNSYNPTDLEVLLSSNGVDAKHFTQVVDPKMTYSNENWKEKVVFFTAPAGIINLAFRVKGVGSHTFYLDNVVIKKVDTCPEPYYVKVTDATTTSVDLEWQQTGGITAWEVIVVNYGEDSTATPIQTVNVTGNPKTTISGLKAGTAYTFYVRAKCGTGNATSDWSSKGPGGTKNGANDDCSGAINIPVNKTLECEVTVSGSLFGATLVSGTPSAACGFNTFREDVWFEFTATSKIHQIKLLDFVNLSETVTNPSIYLGLYDQPCGTQSAALICSTLTPTGANKLDLTGLTPGQKYYVRIGSGVLAPMKSNYLFKLCIGTPEHTAMEVSLSGDKYTVEELVKDVLINSNCDLVSNVKYQVGDGSPQTLNYNAIAYFNKANSLFPFKEGIVLATNEAAFVPGPFTGAQGNNRSRWVGDKDLNDAINAAGGKPGIDDMLVTQLEFDFIPVKDSIKFDYLFASNSYINGCTYTCDNGALFAAWLIDSTTGEGQNLAKIKGTNTPISLGNIWDNKKITGSNCSINPEYFWKNYTSNVSEPIEAPFNFAGSTTAMTSETVYVVPGRKYHIKLAVMDFCSNHSSAVFFSAGSFDLGNLDLGKDLTVENENALCGGEARILKSGLVDDKDVVEIKWYKDGKEIAGENSTELSVNETGTYTVSGYYKEINCTVEGEIKVEIYPPINLVVNKPVNLEICRYVTEPTAIDLTEATKQMFEKEGTDVENYTLGFYIDKEATEPIEDPTQFLLEEERLVTDVFVRIEDTRTGCTETFSFKLVPTSGEIPVKPKDEVVCGEYKLPEVANNQAYYTLPAGEGERYIGGDILGPGKHTLYLHQNNGGTCFEEVSFVVNVTQAVELFKIDDITLECKLFKLPELPENNRYFVEIEGQRIEMYAGALIYTDNTRVYIVAESPDRVCREETSFVVRYNDCPIPKGFSPNGDGINDTFDLSNHGATEVKVYNRNGTEVYSFKGIYTNQWDGKSKGKELPSGTYYYVIKAFDKTRTGWVEINR